MKKKKKVVFFAGRLIMGGLEMVLKNLLDELKKHDDLELIVFADVRETYFKEWFDANKDKIKLYDGRLRTIRKNGLIRALRWQLQKIRINSVIHNVDAIIDCRGECSKFLKSFSGKKIIWIHGGFDHLMKSMNIESVLSYDRIICLTESFKNDFISVFPQHSNKIVKIYNIVNHREIAEKSKTAFAPHGKYFVHVARINPDKDIKTLLLGFDGFWRKNGRPDVSLYLVGKDGGCGEKKRLDSLLKYLECRNNVIFVGNIPEPFGYMRDALANILSSPQEGMSIVLIEAAACRTINIASDCKSGPREILLDGAAGLLFPVGNYEALSQAMTDVYNKNIDTEKMIKNGKRGLARFDATTIAQQFMECIK